MKLASEQEDLTRRIAERRMAIRLGREGATCRDAAARAGAPQVPERRPA